MLLCASTVELACSDLLRGPRVTTNECSWKILQRQLDEKKRTSGTSMLYS